MVKKHTWILHANS